MEVGRATEDTQERGDRGPGRVAAEKIEAGHQTCVWQYGSLRPPHEGRGIHHLLEEDVDGGASGGAWRNPAMVPRGCVESEMAGDLPDRRGHLAEETHDEGPQAWEE